MKQGLDQYGQVCDQLEATWYSFFSEVSPEMQLIPIPNRAHQNLRWIRNLDIAGIVLSGGGDPRIASPRQELENWLLEKSKELSIPVLGVCRGMQVMGLMAGASLTNVEGHDNTRHSGDGLIVGEVNSFHNYSLDMVPHGFECVARSFDGEIEAIRQTQLKWLGIMWHPEREISPDAHDVRLVRELFI